MGKARYRDDDGQVYHADSCTPLEEAWKKGELELHTLARGNYPGRRMEKEELTGIRSIGFWDARKVQTWGLPWHRNEGIELCFLESGALDFLIGQEHYRLRPGHITITRPWLRHKLGNPHIGPSRLHWLILDVSVRHPHQEWDWPSWVILNPRDLETLTIILRQNEQPVWTAGPETAECFQQIGRTIEQGDRSGCDSRLKIYINTLLMNILESFRSGEIRLDEGLMHRRRTVELFLADLKEHAGEPWTLRDMAEQCNLGITRFSMYCKQITNCSPLAYLNQLRLGEARRLLLERPDLHIAEIAYEAGFSSPQYFTTSFKRLHRLSPQAYRERGFAPSDIHRAEQVAGV